MANPQDRPSVALHHARVCLQSMAIDAPSRELSLAITAVEMAIFWNAAARDGIETVMATDVAQEATKL